MSAFAKLATLTAATKRAPAVSGGKRGDAVVHLANLACTPLDPVPVETARDLAQRLALQTPVRLLETYIDGRHDVRENDVLVVGQREYPIRACDEWGWAGSVYRHLILEDLKR